MIRKYKITNIESLVERKFLWDNIGCVAVAACVLVWAALLISQF